MEFSGYNTLKSHLMTFFSLTLLGSLAVPAAFAQCDNYDIYAYSTRTGNIRQITKITEGSEFNPAWAPDEKRIVHEVIFQDEACSLTGHDLYITDVRTGVSTALVGGEGGNDADWSPDGGKIAFDRIPDGKANIYIIDSNGGTPVLIREDALNPAWSPDGSKLAFYQPSDGSVRTIDLATGAETMIAAQGNNPDWSPNGRAMLYGMGDLYTVRIDEKAVPKAAPVLIDTGAGSPAWLGNGAVVYHVDRNGEFDIWSTPSKGGLASHLTGLPGQGDFDPAVSFNNRYVAFSSITLASTEVELSAVNPGLFDTGSVLAEAEVPESTTLYQNYPNPFNPATRISFFLPEANFVTLKVYNILGQEVSTLASTQFPEGHNAVTWETGDLPSGIYVYRLQSKGIEITRTMQLLR